MCRNIKVLFNFDPPATEEEIAASALQFVRKVSGMRTPSKANQKAFDAAVDKITTITRKLILEQLDTRATSRDRESEKAKAVERGRKRVERMKAALAED